MKCKSNNNVIYSYKYHVVFCPKYRRPVLVDGVVDAFSNDNVMGVDLGIKCPAVSYCPDGSVKFYGNGRKNNHSLHTWSFYRLATFIEYKAKLAGIKVEYVDPAYTSQICPICGSVHHANDRNYTCRCGFHTHRDLLGAINICNSTEYIGNRYTA